MTITKKIIITTTVVLLLIAALIILKTDIISPKPQTDPSTTLTIPSYPYSIKNFTITEIVDNPQASYFTATYQETIIDSDVEFKQHSIKILYSGEYQGQTFNALLTSDASDNKNQTYPTVKDSLTQFQVGQQIGVSFLSASGPAKEQLDKLKTCPDKSNYCNIINYSLDNLDELESYELGQEVSNDFMLVALTIDTAPWNPEKELKNQQSDSPTNPSFDESSPFFINPKDTGANSDPTLNSGPPVLSTESEPPFDTTPPQTSADTNPTPPVSQSESAPNTDSQESSSDSNLPGFLQ